MDFFIKLLDKIGAVYLGISLAILGWYLTVIENIPGVNLPAEDEAQIIVGVFLSGPVIIVLHGLSMMSRSCFFDFDFIEEHYRVKRCINNLKSFDRDILIEKIENKEYFFSYSVNDIDVANIDELENKEDMQKITFDRMINWFNLLVEQGILEYVSEYKGIYNYKFTGYAIQIIEKGLKKG